MRELFVLFPLPSSERIPIPDLKLLKSQIDLVAPFLVLRIGNKFVEFMESPFPPLP